MNYSPHAILKVITLLFLSTLSIGCAARPMLPVGVVPDLTAPVPSELSKTQAAVEGRLSGSPQLLPSASPEVVRVARIIRRLKTAAGGKNINYPIYVFDGGPEYINAMVINGSVILVYKELVNRLKSDDQLAAVLAHELGHLSAKHSEDKGAEERSSWVKVGSMVLGVAASVAVGRAGGGGYAARSIGQTTAGIANKVGDGGIVKAYGRSMETEADQIGLVLMAKAGYRPEAAIEVWNNSEQLLGTGNSGPSFFSTHPSPSDRSEKLTLALPVALQNFREQSSDEKIAEAKLDKLKATESQNVEEAHKIYQQAMREAGMGKDKSAVKSFQKFIALADKYQLNNEEVASAKFSLSLLESRKGGKRIPFTTEEEAVLNQLQDAYKQVGMGDNDVQSLMENIRVSGQYQQSGERLKFYKELLGKMSR